MATTKRPSPRPKVFRDEIRCPVILKSTGKRCGNARMRKPGRGDYYKCCAMHTPARKSKRFIDKKERELKKQQALMEGGASRFEARDPDRMRKLAGTKEHPIRHLLHSLYKLSNLVEVYGELASRLDERDKLVVLTTQGTKQVHPVILEYHSLIKERARVAKLCLDAGVDERQVRIAEAKAHLIQQVMYGILDDLGVSIESKKTVKVVEKHMAKLTPEAIESNGGK